MLGIQIEKRDQVESSVPKPYEWIRSRLYYTSEVFPFFCLCLPFWFRNKFVFPCILLSGLRRDWYMGWGRGGCWGLRSIPSISPPNPHIFFLLPFKKTQHSWFRNQLNICYEMRLLASKREESEPKENFKWTSQLMLSGRGEQLFIKAWKKGKRLLPFLPHPCLQIPSLHVLLSSISLSPAGIRSYRMSYTMY